MGHVGLTPQSIHALGTFRARGRAEAADLATSDTLGPIAADAAAVAGAGAFSIVIEAVLEPLARQISAVSPVPTIGIGASPACDGQILVLEDMLGMTERTARFVKRFGAVGPEISASISAYAAAVRDGSFPATEQLYVAKPDTLPPLHPAVTTGS
jgi:3-methyl-2-oxobutanoate hydroxymethyltransferase